MNPTAYPPAVAELLAVPCPMPLGPGTPDGTVVEKLRRLSIPNARDAAAARACVAGLWLRFNHLDESHTISQGIDTPEGSFWHAVMHRREPDPDNSKYWWRRVGPHPVLEQLRGEAPDVGYEFASPFDFVDHCERARGTGSEDQATAEKVQGLEWWLLFGWCYRKAVS